MFDRIIDFIIESLTFFQFFTVVDQYEKGVILRLGKFHRKIGAGLHFFRPFFIDSVMTHECVLTTRDLGTQTLQTTDEKNIIVSSVVSYHVSNVKKLLLEVEQAETVLEDTISGLISDYVLANRYENVLSTDMHYSILRQAKAKAKRYGITVDNIYFVDLAEVKTIRLISDSNAEVIEE